MGIRELLVSTMRDYNKRSAIEGGLSRNGRGDLREFELVTAKRSVKVSETMPQA
jgi:hypothetical protein